MGFYAEEKKSERSWNNSTQTHTQEGGERQRKASRGEDSFAVTGSDVGVITGAVKGSSTWNSIPSGGNSQQQQQQQQHLMSMQMQTPSQKATTITVNSPQSTFNFATTTTAAANTNTNTNTNTTGHEPNLNHPSIMLQQGGNAVPTAQPAQNTFPAATTSVYHHGNTNININTITITNTITNTNTSTAQVSLPVTSQAQAPPQAQGQPQVQPSQYNLASVPTLVPQQTIPGATVNTVTGMGTVIYQAPSEMTATAAAGMLHTQQQMQQQQQQIQHQTMSNAYIGMNNHSHVNQNQNGNRNGQIFPSQQLTTRTVPGSVPVTIPMSAPNMNMQPPMPRSIPVPIQMPVQVPVQLPIPTLPNPNIGLTVQDYPHKNPVYNGVNPNYPNLQVLNQNPPVFTVPNFLTPTECEFLINVAQDCLTPAPVVGAGAGEVSPSRTSSTCFLAREDLPRYLAKVCALTGKPVEHCELPQVGRYFPSQQYLQHFDAFDLSNEDGVRFASNGGQRTVTVLVYLNDVERGGHTSFPNLNIDVKPQKGMALVFFPSTIDGLLDKNALHAAKPAVDTKYVSQVWIRQGCYEGMPSKRMFSSVDQAMIVQRSLIAAREGSADDELGILNPAIATGGNGLIR